MVISNRAPGRPGDDRAVLIEGGDLVIQRRPVHAQPGKARTHRRAEFGRRPEHLRPGPGPSQAARLERDPALAEECPDPVDQPRALRDQPVARPVQRRQVELRRALDRDETHLRTLHRLGDGLLALGPAKPDPWAGLVVLVGLDERAHLLRRHRAHLVAELAQPARQVAGPARRLHADPRRRQVGAPRHQPGARQPAPRNHLAAPVPGHDVTRRLAQIDPDGLDLHGSSLHPHFVQQGP
jgi:hypothetical protein